MSESLEVSHILILGSWQTRHLDMPESDTLWPSLSNIGGWDCLGVGMVEVCGGWHGFITIFQNTQKKVFVNILHSYNKMFRQTLTKHCIQVDPLVLLLFWSTTCKNGWYFGWFAPEEQISCLLYLNQRLIWCEFEFMSHASTWLPKLTMVIRIGYGS